MVKNRGGLISALKPGPVVPPGIEKTPDQAARKTQTVDFAHLSDILAFFRGGHFLTLFWSLFHDFDFVTFWWFSFSTFYHFFTFSLFLIFALFWFWWFWWILVNFCCRHHFWPLFVTKLGASMMTHFSSGKPALPLSPLLVVKMCHNLTPDFDIKFWSFFVTFCWFSCHFDEKLDFAIKNRHFCHFFDLNFDQILTIFWVILGSF